jgi:thymidylate kinase
MEALLFAADRCINMSQNIKPALEKGFVAIADRHIDSSIAFIKMASSSSTCHACQM